MSHNDLIMVLTGLNSDEPCSAVDAWAAVLRILAEHGFVLDGRTWDQVPEVAG